MLSDKISDLYRAGEISGFVYLACVEHDVQTVGDIVEMGLLDKPGYEWTHQLSSFIEEKRADETECDTIPPSNDRERFLLQANNIYESKLQKVDVRTASAIKTIRAQYPSFDLFLTRMFLGDLEFWNKFKSFHAVGRKTVDRAHVFAKELELALSREGISIEDIIPPTIPEDKKEDDSNQSTAADISCEEAVLKEAVLEELSSLSVRPHNALIVLLKEAGSYKAFCEQLISEDFDVKNIRNIGRKSIPEIRSFIAALKEVYEGLPRSSESKDNFVDLAKFQPLFEDKMHELSVRSFHAVEALYNRCDRSLSRFMETVSRADFRATSLPAIGRKSAAEIASWIHNFQLIIVGPYEEHESAVREAHVLSLTKQGLKGDVNAIEEKIEALGHFPYFFAIDSYIEQLEKRDKTIIDSQLKVFQGQVLQNRKEGAKALKISPERMRQLRIVLFRKLRNYISWLERIGRQFSFDFRYDLSEVGRINNSEGTHFNDNLIMWAISLIWKKEYELLGDPDAAFSNPYGYDVNLVIVPKSLSSIFDFHAFTHYFEELQDAKRADDVLIPLRDCILGYFKDRVYYEHLDAITFHCRSIIRRVFGFEINNDNVMVERNASRNNAEWIELIIREVGHPMTIEEIYDELEKRHPGKSKSPLALSGAVRTNPNLAPIGRSSTFGLREWDQGERRGGTIREFATEYLLSLEMPIAKLSDIAKYVRQFRPSSSEKSIYSNLLLEANGAFDVFFKGETRYIGLSSYDYGEEYRRFDRIKDAKRDFKTSCTLLEEFVAENGRLPFSNKENEEEKRLSRFWNVQLSQLEKGLLEGEEKSIIESMAERFAGLKIHKKEYDWLQKYDTIKRAIENGFGVSSLSQEKQTWLTNQIHSYKYHTLNESHVKMIEDLINLIKQNADRV